MASFCFQCNVDHYFGPYSDFFITTWKTVDLCEGCGPVIVKNGECIDPRCRDHASPSPERLRAYEQARRHVRTRRGPLGVLYRLRDRLLGTPWEPGLVHEWRLRYNQWRYGDGILLYPGSEGSESVDVLSVFNTQPGWEIKKRNSDATHEATGASTPSGHDPLP